MILVFTNKADAHPTNVIKHLLGCGVPVFRLNTECLLSDYQFSWWCNDCDCDFYIKNKITGLELYGHEITAIWDRRPIEPQELALRSDNEKTNQFLLDEGLGFMQFLRFYLKDVYSIGSIVGDRPAASKMLQLAVARKLGISIPDTCLANTKNAFIPLLRRNENISLKPIGSDGFFTDNDKEYVFYSRKVLSMDVEAQPDEAFCQTACFLQNYIEKNMNCVLRYVIMMSLHAR